MFNMASNLFLSRSRPNFTQIFMSSSSEISILPVELVIWLNRRPVYYPLECSSYLSPRSLSFGGHPPERRGPVTRTIRTILYLVPRPRLT